MSKHTEALRGAIVGQDGAQNPYMPFGSVKTSDLRALLAERDALLEACQTFAEWLRREEESFPNAGERRETPEGEAEWSAWFQENLRLCDLSQAQAIAAIRKATEG